MKREDLIKEMKESVGNKEPIVFFDKMADMFTLLFDRIDNLEARLARIKIQSALAIQWEPRVASNLLTAQVDVLRKDKDSYFQEITVLKQAVLEDKVTQDYHSFCQFWQDTLGWHPFLD